MANKFNMILLGALVIVILFLSWKIGILRDQQQEALDDVKKEIDPKKIQPSDIIKIDVKKHLNKYGDSAAAIIEIASTIVHEATHVLEYVEKGETFDGPGTAVEKAEASFKNWVKSNWQNISRTFNFAGPYPFS